jgi:hypothetical protein
MVQEGVYNYNELWPEFFPQECPPDDSYPAIETVYRLVRINPPKQLDFRSHREMRPENNWPDECEACGLSVHTDRADSERLRRRVPFFKDRLIAQGTLNPDLGKIKPTPSKTVDGTSHHTWWVPQDTEPWTVFICV